MHKNSRCGIKFLMYKPFKLSFNVKQEYQSTIDGNLVLQLKKDNKSKARNRGCIWALIAKVNGRNPVLSVIVIIGIIRLITVRVVYQDVIR